MVKRLGTGAGEIEQAAEALRAGRLVAFPTETVYGLGAVATNDRAVAAIFAAKGRPRFNPLIVHVTDAGAARAMTRWNHVAARLAARFWPGGLTLVLPRAEGCPLSLLVSAGGDTVAVRAPAHPVAHALLAATVLPVAAPSANPVGQVSPTTADHVAAGLGDRIDFLVDGGPCPIGIEFDGARCDLYAAAPAAPRRGHPSRTRSGDRAAGRPEPPGVRTSAAPPDSWPATTRPRARSALTPRSCRRRGAAGVRSAAARRRRPDAEPEPARRSRRGRGQPVRHAARARPARSPGHRGHAGAG